MRVAHLGPYSIDNAGDVLVGLASRQGIRRAIPTAEITTFAPILPHSFWRHEFSAARGVDGPVHPVAPDQPLAWARDHDALIIGGGGLVSSDPHFGAFFLGNAREWREPPAAWNAVGSQNEPWYVPEFDWVYDRLRAATAQLAYVSVRNQATLRYLRRAGVERPVEVVPDAAFGLRLDPGTLGEAILRDAGCDPAGCVVGLSVGSAIRDPRARGFYARLLGWLDARAAAGEIELVVFPFGNVYDDPAFQREALASLPHAHHVVAPLSPVELWALVSALDVYVATRFHAVIAALVHDLPVVILDEYFSDQAATSKLRELACDHGLERWYLCPLISVDPERKLAAALHAARTGSWTFAPELASQRARLDAHYAAMAAALGGA